MFPMIQAISKLFLILVLFSSSAMAGEAEAFFLKGNEYYQAGSFAQALEEYQNVLDTGYESWEVYYNIGNTYFKQGDVARAILNFERAKKRTPENEDVNYNLDFANLVIVDRIQELPEFFLYSWFKTVTKAIGIKTLGILAVGAYLLLMLLLILRVVRRSLFAPRAVVFLTVTASICLLMFGGLFGAHVYQLETRVEAIVLADKIDVKSAPDAAGTDVFALHSGVKVRLEDSSLDWVKIRLSDGKVGWMKKDAIEVI